MDSAAAVQVDSPARDLSGAYANTLSQNLNGALVGLVGVMALGYIVIAALFVRRHSPSPVLIYDDKNYLPTTERYVDGPSL